MNSLNLNFDLDNLDMTEPQIIDSDEKSDRQDSRDIAIIGIDAKIGNAVSKDEIWNAFLEGKNMISDLPAIRRIDLQTMLGDSIQERSGFVNLAYLPRIDLFDPEVFNISPMEAECIAPEQRIFLESAWSAIEDAGYGGNKLNGSKTGVYVGYSSNSAADEIEKNIPDETLGLVVSGYTNSFMASRLSYLLNLRGPSLIIDTACSSSLVALHEACRALRNKDINMAVVGSVHIVPCPGDGEKQMGTSSSTGYTKSFDEKADGTGCGEGVINFVLKPLDDALMDNDHIYGVVKGSCINQDGQSIGLTAPNSEAQTDVIIGAWKDAGVSPDNVSYIEAHGTATKLGDPVEIGGLTGAFSRVTTKKQFCALGAAKSNFGHLDSASGLLGVLKVLLMMQHRIIPPSIHFNTPNRKIDYINSPVFINDAAKAWETDDGVLTAGINSFGLSGTNCHVVLQSFNDTRQHSITHDGKYVLTASAKNKNTLVNIIKSYQKFINENKDIDFQDFCYTVNTGRFQFENRFAGVFFNAQEFIELNENDILSNKYFSDIKEKNDGHNTVASKKNSLLKNEEDLAKLYLDGAEIDFELFYENEQVYRISAPVYAFNHKRFKPIESFSPQKHQSNIFEKPLGPLVDKCAVESDNLWVFEKNISIDSCMEIREHCINGVNVLPGTAYVEMAHFVANYIYDSNLFTFSEITFYSLMICRPNENRILHAIVEKEDESLKIRMLSRSVNESNWTLHCEMSVVKGYKQHSTKNIEIESLLSGYEQKPVSNYDGKEDGFVQLGDHWDCARGIYIGENSLVLCGQVREDLEEDLIDYYISPALLDGSVNGGNALLGEAYLPLNYKDAVFYGQIKGRVYSHIERINPSKTNREVELFNVHIYNENGYLLATVDQYALKRCNESDFLIENVMSNDIHEIDWIPDNQDFNLSVSLSENAIAVLFYDSKVDNFISNIEKRFKKVTYIYVGNESRKISSNEFEVGNTEGEMSVLFKQLKCPKGTVIFNLLGYNNSFSGIDENSFVGLRGTFNLSKALTDCLTKMTLVAIAKNASCITNNEKFINPISRSILSFSSCVGLELSEIDVCAIDTDESTDEKLIFNEINNSYRTSFVGFRENIRYIERISKKHNKKESIVPCDNDVIVIPGGYGGIGLAVSEYLFSRNNDIKIVLLSRTGIVDKENDKRFDLLQKMVDSGYDISVIKADVTKRDEVSNALNTVRNKYAHIDGVIFAAGIGEQGMLINKTWNDEMEVMRVKAIGVWNIDVETKNDDLKYFVMFSSLTAVLEAAGQTAYVAANSFLDSYVLCGDHKNCITMTINWTGWKDSGMAFNWGVDTSNANIYFVSDEEGKELFGAALRTGLRRVATFRFRNKLSPQEYNNIKKRIRLPEVYVMNDDKKEIDTQELEIYGKSIDKITEEEKNVALAWSRTLKINSVNIYSKFFEIGGNSLLASYLQKEINKIYPSVVAITDVFAYSTIADMAKYISEKTGNVSDDVSDSEENGEIEDLVKQFVQGSLSIEEMEQLI